MKYATWGHITIIMHIIRRLFGNVIENGSTAVPYKFRHVDSGTS